MSQKPTLFLAHSSRDKPLVTRLHQAIAAVPGIDFDLFLDSENIAPGDEWNAVIEDHLLECSAALLFLSPNAIEAPYMPHEAFLLSLRRRFDSSLRLIPVFAGGMTEADLANSPFKHCRLELQQAVFIPENGDVAPAAAAIAAVLPRASDLFPHRGLVEAAAGALKSLDDSQIDLAIEFVTIEDDRRAVRIVRNKRRWLASRLFQLSVADLGRFAYHVAPLFSDNPGGFIRLLKILLPFVWVPSEAGEMLRQEVRRPRPRRAVALEVGRIRNLSPRLPRVDPGEVGEFPCVPELFARRACSTYPPWKVLSLNVTWSHDLSADLERSLRDLALDALDATYWPDAYDADQLRDELREFVKSHGPILVVLPKSYVPSDADVLKALVEFSEAFTFLLTAEQHAPDLVHRFPNLIVLQNLPLSAQRELDMLCLRAINNLKS